MFGVTGDLTFCLDGCYFKSLGWPSSRHLTFLLLIRIYSVHSVDPSFKFLVNDVLDSQSRRSLNVGWCEWCRTKSGRVLEVSLQPTFAVPPDYRRKVSKLRFELLVGIEFIFPKWLEIWSWTFETVKGTLWFWSDYTKQWSRCFVRGTQEGRFSNTIPRSSRKGSRISEHLL